MSDRPADTVVLLGVTGGIAAYKAVEVSSRLRRAGAEVHVIMTAAATRLVTPLTFGSITGQPVYTDLLQEPRREAVEHIALARRAHLLLIAPATADVIGKLAAGIADDFLTTEALAVTCPVLVCPAMNADMYAHRAVQRNLQTLRDLGYLVLEPDHGRLATGAVGPGRLPDPEAIVARAMALLAGHGQDLAGVPILVTAGGTREPIDPVRFISNHSSGKMGFALAAAARDRGAKVTLVTAPATVSPPPGVEVVPVQTAQEMYDAVLERFADVRVVLKAAAVADYRVARPAPGKLKKGQAPTTLELELNPDILAELGHRKGRQVLVGFAAETGNPVAEALRKLRRKGLDLIVANDVSDPDSGFGADTNRVWICGPGDAVEELPLLGKREVADRVLDRVVSLL